MAECATGRLSFCDLFKMGQVSQCMYSVPTAEPHGNEKNGKGAGWMAVVRLFLFGET